QGVSVTTDATGQVERIDTTATLFQQVGFAAGRVWRAFGAVVLVLPALAMIAGLASGTFEADLGLVAWTSVAVVLAILLWLGLRLGHVLVTAVGGAVMVLAVIDAGMLFLAFWVAGGVYLAIGVIAWVCGTAQRSSTRANVAQA